MGKQLRGYQELKEYLVFERYCILLVPSDRSPNSGFTVVGWLMVVMWVKNCVDYLISFLFDSITLECVGLHTAHSPASINWNYWFSEGWTKCQSCRLLFYVTNSIGCICFNLCLFCLTVLPHPGSVDFEYFCIYMLETMSPEPTRKVLVST